MAIAACYAKTVPVVSFCQSIEILQRSQFACLNPPRGKCHSHSSRRTKYLPFVCDSDGVENVERHVLRVLLGKSNLIRSEDDSGYGGLGALHLDKQVPAVLGAVKVV